MSTKSARPRWYAATLLIVMSTLGAGSLPATAETLLPALAPSQTPASPDPGGKQGSPLTDLNAYPKYTPADLEAAAAKERGARSAGPPPDKNTAEIVSREELSDGRVRVDFYTLAAEADPEKVADSLRKSGRKNVEVLRPEPQPSTDGEVQPMGPGDCTYGQAHAFTCPNVWWTNLGRRNPVVLFNDHSGATWPTTNAVYKWNQTPNIDSWYTWNNCNQAGVHCVGVWSANYGATGWIGHTNLIWASTKPGQIRDADVQLNDYYTGTYFTRNNVVTHELGHVLGLGHNDYWNDVMYYSANTREDIGGENPALLAQIYSIDRE
ncbi:M57 family metalloprotease [Nonomuraea sp. NPDC050783]|uniref:M57 family metalloprotease n=1 Tax=Nonomuraea sp. NPDC050783 TaxID=3154634 RepID=UPI0034657AEF